MVVLTAIIEAQLRERGPQPPAADLPLTPAATIDFIEGGVSGEHPGPTE
ncbi:MAG: hypothetical protein KF718_24935 [Polyangiaceae bacterium]|nr:hypothetical protein [Polyangiaceae bacterium]